MLALSRFLVLIVFFAAGTGVASADIGFALKSFVHGPAVVGAELARKGDEKCHSMATRTLAYHESWMVGCTGEDIGSIHIHASSANPQLVCRCV